MIIYLCVLEAYDKVGNTAVTLYFSTEGFTSAPGDLPANTFFDPRIEIPARIRRTLFSPGRTFGQSQVGFGDLILANEDGGLDFLEDYAFDGRTITQYRGPEGAAFPGGYTEVMVATMEQGLPNRRSYVIKIRDRQDEVDVPLQTTKYAGDNALPDGLEGVGDLRGKPKPVCFGIVKNIAPPLVNSAKLIYQVNDGAIVSLNEVYDSGIGIARSPTSWTQETTPSAAQHINCMSHDPNANRWAVGLNGGGIWTSDNDGVTWTVRTSSFGGDSIRDIIWAEELSLWVACGTGAKIATSPDAINWTQRTNTFNSQVLGLAFDGTIIVAVGDDQFGGDGLIETSTDGTTWTSRTPAASSEAWNSVHWGRGLFITGSDPTASVAHIATSPDGITWTETTQHRFTARIEEITFGRGRWVAVSRGDPQIGFSDDGIVWSAAPNPGDPVGGSDLFGVFYSDLMGLFFAIGDDAAGDQMIVVSGDGYQWRAVDAGFGEDAVFTGFSSTNAVVLGGVLGTVATASVEAAYASEADLLDDDNTPPPGSFNVFLAGGIFRLGSPALGVITADVTQGSDLSFPRSAGKIFTSVLTKVGLTAADWSEADIDTLNATLPDVCGFWSGTNEILASAVLNILAESITGWWGIDALGKFRIKELLSPAASSSLLTITDADIIDLRRIAPKDPGRGIPSYRSIVRYNRNYTVQAGNALAGGVADVRRAELAQEWLEEIDTDADVQVEHLLAREQAYHTLLTSPTDASTAAERIQALRGVKRGVYGFSVPHKIDVEALDMGDIITIVHPRFGLLGGKKVVIMTIEANPSKDTINMETWG